jgi:hypothetical protein
VHKSYYFDHDSGSTSSSTTGKKTAFTQIVKVVRCNVESSTKSKFAYLIYEALHMHKEVLERTKAIEGALQGLGATGKGMHEKLDSIESQLPAEIVRKIRLVATIRNKFVHEPNYVLDHHAFFSAADTVTAYFYPPALNAEPKHSPNTNSQVSSPNPFASKSAPKEPSHLLSDMPKAALTVAAAKAFWDLPLKKKLLAGTAAVAACAVAIKLNI